jgi:enterochelin esterase-like enzyme
VPLSRRQFCLATAVSGVSGVAATLGAMRDARASEPVDGDDAHPIDPPAALEFRTMTWEKTAFYGGPNTAIVAVPKGLAAGERLPLCVLMPGGHHTLQRREMGCWGWWSEYHLHEADAALRRGVVDKKDFHGHGRDLDLELVNDRLASRPYRGMVFVTPWTVGRQLEPAPHGTMVAEFLRDLVERAREELPVLPTREATGLGGMSVGGMFTLFSGPLCSDLFGHLVATQPFTENLVPPLLEALKNGKQRQTLRMITSDYDHQRESTLALSEGLRVAGIEHELVEYAGPHSATFAAGPGALDAALVFDRRLRGERLDGTRPLPTRDGLIAPMSIGDLEPRAHAAPRPVAPAAPSRLPVWPFAAIGAVTVAAAAAIRRARH